MIITVNGEAAHVVDGTTLQNVVASFRLPDRGVALALNGAVVPRSDWPTTELSNDAQVEVITAMQGG